MNQGFISGVGKIPWRRERLPTSVFCLGNPRDRSAWLQSIASQRVGHDVALSHHRGGREYRNKGEAVKKCSAAMGLGPSPSRGNIHNNIFEFFCRNPLTPWPRWRMVVTSGWAQDSWNTTLLPHHQPIGESHTPCSPHPKFAYKNFSPKTIEEFGVIEQRPPILFPWPCDKFVSAPNSNFLVCLAWVCIGQMNLGSVTKAKQKASIWDILDNNQFCNTSWVFNNSI